MDGDHLEEFAHLTDREILILSMLRRAEDRRAFDTYVNERKQDCLLHAAAVAKVAENAAAAIAAAKTDLEAKVEGVKEDIAKRFETPESGVYARFASLEHSRSRFIGAFKAAGAAGVAVAGAMQCPPIVKVFKRLIGGS